MVDQVGYKDEMSNQQDTPSTKKRIAFSYFLLFSGIGISSSLLGPSRLNFTHQTNSTLQQIGLLFILGTSAYVIWTWIGGRIFDHVHGHRLLFLSLLIMGVSCFQMPIGPTLLILAFLSIVMSIYVCVSDVGGNTFLIWMQGDKAEAYLNGLFFFNGFGAFLDPIVVAGIIKLNADIPMAYWFATLMISLVAIFIFFLPSPIIRTNEPWVLTQQVNTKRLAEFGLLLFIVVGVKASLGGWLFTFVVTIKSATEITASKVVFAFWGALILSRLLVIPFIQLAQSKVLLVCCNIIGLISLAMLAPNKPIFIRTAFIGLGMSLGLIYPALISITQSYRISSDKRIGRLLSACGIGAMSMPWIVKRFFKPTGRNILLVKNGLSFITSFIILLNIKPSYAKEMRLKNLRRCYGNRFTLSAV
jgi:fucose permease